MSENKTENHDDPPTGVMECDDDEEQRRLKRLIQRIVETRQKRGLSIEALANSVGISKGNLSDIENLKRNPRYTTLVAIAEGLGLTISELLSGI